MAMRCRLGPSSCLPPLRGNFLCSLYSITRDACDKTLPTSHCPVEAKRREKQNNKKMAKRGRAAILPNNIILLQNLVKRDPESYKEEFLQQYSHYESLRDILILNGPTQVSLDDLRSSSDNNNNTNGGGEADTAYQLTSSTNSNNEVAIQLLELIGFVAQVCPCFPQETANFPNELRQLLLEHHTTLPFDLKEKVLVSLNMLRNKGVITAEELMQTLFPLLIAYSTQGTALTVNSHAKELRKLIYNILVTLLKNCNSGSKNQKLNRSTQAICFNMLEQPDSQGIWAARLTRELWRRGIWDDSRTVEIMTHAALRENDVKIAMAGVMFFLDADREREENFEDGGSDGDNDGDNDNDIDIDALRHRLHINKKSGKRAKKLNAALKAVKRKNNSSRDRNSHDSSYLNFSAIQLLRDPQGFAEKLFKAHLSGNGQRRFNLDQKIAIMQLLSRLIGTHKLLLLNVYTFFLKFLTPKQRDVTRILAACAQACHELVPPESLNVMVRKIADEFVSDGVSSEVAAAGLNTIREICVRAPLAIDETLLQDLTEYKGSKDKGVAMAAKSLVTLYREVATDMLKRKDRGKLASMEMQDAKRRGESSRRPQFGVENTVQGIEGIELLAKWKKEHEGEDGDEEDSDNWEIDEDANNGSDADDIDGEWVTVESDKEYDVDMDSSDSDSDSDLDLGDDTNQGKTEKKKEEEENKQTTLNSEEAFQQVASTRILTPADFAKLEELKTEERVSKLMGIKHDELVDADSLVGPIKHRKQTREERLAKVMEGREGREKFGSSKGKRDQPRSTTNREKQRKKNFVMMVHKKSVTGKRKMSLRDKQKILRAHITRQKKGY